MTSDVRASAGETPVRRHFDAVAETWASRYETVPSFRTRLRLVAMTAGRLLEGVERARVLDVGSGPGVLAGAVSSHAVVVVCLDTSVAMLKAGGSMESRIGMVPQRMGLQHYPGRVVRVAGTSAAVSGAVKSPFDLVLAISVLEYQRDPSSFLAEIASLVNPGGYVLFSVPNRRSVVRWVERPIDRIAAVAGRILGVARLAHREYSASRPFGSKVPWPAALTTAGFRCKEVLPMPLGDTGVRAVLRANLLVVAQAP